MKKTLLIVLCIIMVLTGGYFLLTESAADKTPDPTDEELVRMYTVGKLCYMDYEIEVDQEATNDAYIHYRIYDETGVLYYTDSVSRDVCEHHYATIMYCIH